MIDVGQKTFLDFVEQTTERLEIEIAARQEPNEPDEPNEPTEPQQFLPKQDMKLTIDVTKKLGDIWHTIHHHAKFDQWLDIILAALERRESDYMSLIEGIDRRVLDGYAKMYSVLYIYFLDGYYGDPLGSFYMENFSYGRGGEFYTPWNIAHMMAKMMNPTPEETVCDPCSGSGIMLLAARCVIHENYGWLTSSRYGRNLYGTDISSRAVKMSKINLYLTDYIYMICLMHEVGFEFKKKMEDEKNGKIRSECNNGIP